MQSSYVKTLSKLYWILPFEQLQSEMMNSNVPEWEAEKGGKNTANKLQQYQPSYYRYPKCFTSYLIH